VTLRVVEARGDPVEEIAEKARRVRELRRRIEELMKALEEKFSGPSRLRLLVENLKRTKTPPSPPPQDRLTETATELSTYEAELREYLKDLTETIEILSRIADFEGKVSTGIKEAEEWAAKAEGINPYHASQVRRIVEKAQRALNDLPAVSPRESLRELTTSYEELSQAVRLCRAMYMNRIKELEGMVGSLRKLLDKARRVARLEDAEILERARQKIEEAEARLSEARTNAPRDSLNPVELRESLIAVEESLKSIISSSMSEEEERVLKEYGRLVKAYEGRHVALSTLIDQLSRATGLTVEQVQEKLYSLDRKSLIRVLAKLS